MRKKQQFELSNQFVCEIFAESCDILFFNSVCLLFSTIVGQLMLLTDIHIYIYICDQMNSPFFDKHTKNISRSQVLIEGWSQSIIPSTIAILWLSLVGKSHTVRGNHARNSSLIIKKISGSKSFRIAWYCEEWIQCTLHWLFMLQLSRPPLLG